jgi:hypothetical protein
MKFYSDSFRTSLIPVVNANEFSPFQLAIYPRMIAAKLPRSHNCGADSSRISPSAAHFLFVPPEALFGSTAVAGANA